MANEPVIVDTQYKIVITKVQHQVPYTKQEWVKLRDDPTKDPTGENQQYGYVTKDSVHDVETDILEQVVDKLDMPTVIKAINGLQ